MKTNNFFLIISILFLCSGFIINGCSKEEHPIDEEIIDDPITVTDIDGNNYQVTQIGEQFWMTRNLRVTRYNNGDAINTGLSNTQWFNTSEGAYAVYPHNQLEGLNTKEDVKNSYGLLYNWHAVETEMICPTGWRVPSDDDWEELAEFIGGRHLAGGLLRSTRTTPQDHPRWELWENDQLDISDEFEFSALPGGYCDDHGQFESAGHYGHWWKTTGVEEFTSHFVIIGYEINPLKFSSSTSSSGGRSIRCIMN